MEIDNWKDDFKKYMDFVYENKRYPNIKSINKDEVYLFNWSKKQRCFYTKNKLSKDKIKLLNDFKFWYFKSSEKNNKINDIKLFFSNQKSDNIVIDHKNTNNINNNIIINISNLNVFYEKEDNDTKKESFLSMIYTKFINYINIYSTNNNLYIDNV